MKHKKGALLMYGLMAGLIGAIIVLIIHSGSKTEFNIIGESSLVLLGTSKTAEEALFYIDQSAKYSLQQAVYDLAKNGGVSEVEETGTDEAFAFYECGRFNDAYVWFEISKDAEGKYLEKECFNNAQTTEYIGYLFDKNLNKYLENYPHNIPTSNYYYEFRGNLEVIGKAKEPIRFDIIGEIEAAKPKPFQGFGGSRSGGAGGGTEFVVEGDKDLIDFTGLEKAKLGEEVIDIKGLCPKGKICKLSREAFNNLLRAQKTAKQKGASLEIRSSYRSLKQQTDIWEGNTPEKYKQRYDNEEIRRKYVCDPTKEEPEKRCPHLSGNAVDVRLQGRQMNSNDWKLLYQIMTATKNNENQPAWVKYRPEPWHFECCETERYVRAIEQGVTELV